MTIKPLKADRLKDVFIKRFEELILSGYFSIGEKLPSERELALKLGVSRPVVHEGLLDLRDKGLVTMKSRFGTYVNDYRKEGSLALLTTLFEYGEGEVSLALQESLLDMRMVFEVETARLAAINRSDEHMLAYYDLLDREAAVDHSDVEEVTDLDFQFHHLTAMASENLIYPLLMNSIRKFYTNLTKKFFSHTAMVDYVFDFHQTFVEAVRTKDSQGAGIIMKAMLFHGEKNL